MKSSLVLLVLLACLAACGTKGPLFLPRDKAAPAPPPAAQPAAPGSNTNQQQNPVK